MDLSEEKTSAVHEVLDEVVKKVNEDAEGEVKENKKETKVESKESSESSSDEDDGSGVFSLETPLKPKENIVIFNAEDLGKDGPIDFHAIGRKGSSSLLDTQGIAIHATMDDGKVVILSPEQINTSDEEEESVSSTDMDDLRNLAANIPPFNETTPMDHPIHLDEMADDILEAFQQESANSQDLLNFNNDHGQQGVTKESFEEKKEALTMYEQCLVATLPKNIFGCCLDNWFNGKCLNPKVEALIYWRDVKLSGIVFGSILVTLLSLSYFSFITVVANIGLAVLGITISFRIYKDVLQAVQKTPQSHPLQKWLDLDISLPKEKVSELLDVVLAHVNASLVELRRLFLVQDLVDSLKFAVVLWALTYVGGWFNGLTLVLIAFVGLFTLPKVYENNKQEIDQYYQLGYGKLLEITNKVNDILPGALKKRVPEKKD